MKFQGWPVCIFFGGFCSISGDNGSREVDSRTDQIFHGFHRRENASIMKTVHPLREDKSEWCAIVRSCKNGVDMRVHREKYKVSEGRS
jgi:hypothetical protein